MGYLCRRKIGSSCQRVGIKFFTNINNLNTQEVDAPQSVLKNSLYDLILGDLPFGRNLVEWVDGARTIKVKRNWLEILKCLGFLGTNGTALFLLEPPGFSTSMGVTFEKILIEHGFLSMLISIVLKEYSTRKRQ